MRKNDYLKCNTCANARPVISNNGYHYVCTLSDRKGTDCMMNNYKHWKEIINRNHITISKDAKVSGNTSNRVDVGGDSFILSGDQLFHIKNSCKIFE